MNIREAVLGMIKAMPGGWGAMCGALAMTRDAVENRVYERKGQSLLIETAMAMQSFSGTTLFAEAVATESGGTFVKLPEGMAADNDVLMLKFSELYAELGALSSEFSKAVDDDVIDAGERRKLESGGARVHRVLSELQAIMFKVYCPNQGISEDGDSK